MLDTMSAKSAIKRTTKRPATRAKLGVNIDHVATLRQLRGTPYPNLLEAAKLAEEAGADQITVHLREDRRHIQDEDVRSLKKILSIPLNLEMAVTPEMLQFASKLKPSWVCLVPEKRRELTTEGGLNLTQGRQQIEMTIHELKRKGIRVSCFIEPSEESVRQSYQLGADAVELHTGLYCVATQEKRSSNSRIKKELKRIEKAGLLAHQLGLKCHAGHGFDLTNVKPVAGLKNTTHGLLFEEYNIGHAIVCRALFVGFKRAVQEMRAALRVNSK